MEQDQNVQVRDGLSSILRKKSGTLVSILVFLLPVFFLSPAFVELYVVKIVLLTTFLVALFAVFVSSVIVNGVIEIPKVKYLIPIALFGLVALIASLFSGQIVSSIAGHMFESGTAGSFLILVFSLFITLVSVKSVKVVSKTIFAFLYASIFLVGYTLIEVFASSLLPSILTNRMPLFIGGGLTDTAVILGVTVIFALCALNMSELSIRLRYVLMGLIAFSVLFIGASGFLSVIIILGLISLILFVYVLSWSFGTSKSANPDNAETAVNPEEHHRHISFSALAVLVVMTILALGGSSISGYLASAMKLQTLEVRPNFEATSNLALGAWKQNFAFGVGPNRFAEFWNLHKPIEINQTQFWGTDFYSGSGFVPTVAVTTGLLGSFALIAFFGMYLLSGVKAIFAQANSTNSRYLATATFLASVYLWIILFVYTPSIAVLALAFIFTGLFTATLAPQGIVGMWSINIFSNPKTNFLSVLVIVILLIMSIAGGYFVWERGVAYGIFQNGMRTYQTTADIAKSKALIEKSINLVQRDLYWRGLAEIYIADLNRILASVTNKEQFSDSVRIEAQSLIASAVNAAKKAVEMDRNNFQNWFALARVYEIFAANGIEGSLESARSAYAEAALRAPNNPAVPLSLARLDMLVGDLGSARNNIAKSLELKNNYTDAYYTLAQLEASANNIPGAIKSVEAVTIVEPNNPGLYFQLGLLRYNQKDFSGAVDAFERAVTLTPNYANAQYFLGISYYLLDRKAAAIEQFESLKRSNPDNQEIELILSNMKAGKSLFANAKPPVDNKPEKRNELPVKESN